MRVPSTPTSSTARRARPALAAVLAAVLALTALAAGPAAATATQGDPTVAPVTTISADGRTGTDGTRTLAISQTADLDGAGVTVSVGGSGYDENKGVYVALCAIPPRNYVPTPCGGGVDTEGTQGAAQWISSNPPSYGVGLAQPYGPGGSFQTAFSVRAEIAPGIDCRQVRCAIVTRNDHTRTSDRSQDIIVPVTFRAASVTPTPTDPTPTNPGQTVPSTTAPVVTVPPLANPTTTLPAPTATVAADGLSASDGTRTLAVTKAADLDPETSSITVTGTGFDATRGIYVGLCAISAAGEAPGPCRTGSAEANRWVSSNPPDYGVGVATPFADGGTFEVELSLDAVIDAATDCRTTACAVVARADDTNAEDRTLDLAVPVAFAAASAGTTVPPTTEATDGGLDDDVAAETEDASSVVIDDTGSSSGPIIAVIAAVVVLAAAGAAFAATRRRGTGVADRSSITATTADPPAAGPEPDAKPGTDTGAGA